MTTMVWHLLLVDGERVTLNDDDAVAAYFAPRSVSYQPDVSLRPDARGRLYVDDDPFTVAALLTGPDLDDRRASRVLRRIRPSSEWPSTPAGED